MGRTGRHLFALIVAAATAWTSTARAVDGGRESQLEPDAGPALAHGEVQFEDGGVVSKPVVDVDKSQPFKWTGEELDYEVGGLAFLKCDVSVDGIPSKCKVIRSLPGISDGQFIEYCANLRFRPARMGGVAVPFTGLTCPVRLKVVDDEYKPRVRVEKPPRMMGAESKAWKWTKAQLAAPKPMKLRARCLVTPRGRLERCEQTSRPDGVSEDQFSEFLDGLRYSPALDKDGNPVIVFNFDVPVVLYNP